LVSAQPVDPSASTACFSSCSPSVNLCSTLATFSYRSATIWDTRTGEPLHRFFFDIPASPRFDPGLAFSPDTKRFACRTAADRITVWDLADGKEVRRFQVATDRHGFEFCRFSADGTFLIAQVSEDVAWLNVDTGAVARRLRGVQIKQLAPDEKTFAVVSQFTRQVLIGDALPLQRLAGGKRGQRRVAAAPN